MPESKYRSFIFTLFHHDDEEDLRQWLSNFNTTFWEAGHELCPTTSQQHWQGWLYLKSPRTFKSMCKAIKGHGQINIMRGSHSDNEKYCTKDGNAICEGKRPEQGHRTDLEEAVKCESIRELFETQCPNFQTIRVLEKHLEYCEQPSIREVSVHRIGMEDFREYAHIYLEDAYTYNGSWHGYDGQTKLIQCMGGQLNPIPTEVYEGLPYRVQAGGTSRQVRVTDIILIK